jgi:hypothetical protein
VPYAAPSGHPVGALLARAERLLATREYAAQSELLSEAGLPETAAGLELFARDDTTVFTVAVWTVTAPTLLPRADFVGLVVEGAEPFFVPWASVVEDGMAAEAVEYRPVRYRTASEPDPQMVAALRQRAVDP